MRATLVPRGEWLVERSLRYCGRISEQRGQQLAHDRNPTTTARSESEHSTAANHQCGCLLPQTGTPTDGLEEDNRPPAPDNIRPCFLRTAGFSTFRVNGKAFAEHQDAVFLHGAMHTKAHISNVAAGVRVPHLERVLALVPQCEKDTGTRGSSKALFDQRLFVHACEAGHLSSDRMRRVARANTR